MKLKSLSIIAFSLAFSATLLISCGDKTEDPPPTTPAKTLNKTTILNKKWYNQGGSIVHEFKSNGVYVGGQGSWKWVNNSDTIETKDSPADNPLYWKMLWNTDHEMSCEKAGTGGALLYKDQAW